MANLLKKIENIPNFPGVTSHGEIRLPRGMIGMKKILFLLILVVMAVPLIWVLVHKYEGTAPRVEVSLPSLYLKKSFEMGLDAGDPGTGLRNVQVSVVQQGNEKVLLDKTYPPSSILNLLGGPSMPHERFTLNIEVDKLGLTDGEALIRIRVSDNSWRSWNKGNVTYFEQKLIVDSTPPKITILSKQHNVSKGGSGLVIYRTFEPDLKTGVKVGDNFFPGYPGMFDDKEIYAAFFALDYTQGPGTKIRVIAEDAAGNSIQKGFYHYIRDKKFKIDTLNISDRFLGAKMPDFSMGGEHSGADDSMLDKFLKVNGAVRKANVEKVLAAPSDTVNQVLWKGRFGRLAGAATRSGFADHRIYRYNGKEIDRAVHLGIDLASTAQAPVKAANSGRVIMAEAVGIFGNTIILDHGFGLASLYSHLSSMAVRPGDKVGKEDILGNTGLTGLAGGDHLHFSIIVHNVFVNPVEWWDASWIKNNITSKIEAIGTLKN